jgi:glycosyltransferase involved in cell wall biosynthesis
MRHLSREQSVQVLRVHNRYQERGGEDVSFESEIKLLSDRGHAVKTLEFTNDDIPPKRSLRATAELGINTIWSQRARQRIGQAIRGFQPDLVHFDNTFPLVSPATYSVCQRQGVPVVQTLHNYRLMCPSATFFRDGRPCEDCLGKTPPLPGVIHGCYRGSRAQTAVAATMLTAHRVRGTWREDIDRYIALTQFSKQKFIEGGLPAKKIAIKPHFLDSDPGPGASRNGAFVFAGRLADYKGVALLPEAWHLIEGDVPLHVIGDGPDSAFLAQRAARDPRLFPFGRKPKQEVLNEMRMASAVLVPSILYETFGLTIVEAFACGTPVIASRLGAMAELVEDGRTGLLFEPGNADDLAAKVRWADDHPEEMRRMGANARQEYERKYTPDRNYELLMEIYHQAIEHARARR